MVADFGLGSLAGSEMDAKSRREKAEIIDEMCPQGHAAAAEFCTRKNIHLGGNQIWNFLSAHAVFQLSS